MVKVIHGSKENTPGGNKPEVLPDGTYTFEIVKSEARQSPFENVKTADNPEGWELNLWLDTSVNGKRYRLFDSIPVTKVYRLNEVLLAAGFPLLTKDAGQFEESILEGRSVIARSYIGKNGKARVGEYLYDTARTLDAKPSKPKPKASATDLADSDIPF
jgi:hypothetical protein